MRKWNHDHGIITQAWSPLGRASDLLTNPLLKTIAERLGKEVGQVILRWHHQLGSVPIPKSATPERQINNRSIFDFALTEDDMTKIAFLARADGRLADQNPATYEEF